MISSALHCFYVHTTEQNRTETNRTKQNGTEQNRTPHLTCRAYPHLQNVIFQMVSGAVFWQVCKIKTVCFSCIKLISKAFALFCREFGIDVIHTFLVLIFWAKNAVGATIFAFCNYVIKVMMMMKMMLMM